MDSLKEPIIRYRCPKCKIEKDSSQFYKGGKYRNYRCASCQKEEGLRRNKIKSEGRLRAKIEDMEGEIWVPVFGNELTHLVSNCGRIKSVDRYSYRKLINKDVLLLGKLIKQNVRGGYYSCPLKLQFTHKIVFRSFNRDVEMKSGYTIDHIDENKLNNNLNNLQYITTRSNISKNRLLQPGRTSRFTGVSWSKQKKKWAVGIYVNGKVKSLGKFILEADARDAYLAELNKIT